MADAPRRGGDPREAANVLRKPNRVSDGDGLRKPNRVSDEDGLRKPNRVSDGDGLRKPNRVSDGDTQAAALLGVVHAPSPDVRLGPPGLGSLHVRGASPSWLRLLP
jgi:hypothetical protein